MDKNTNCFGTVIRKARENNQLTIDELADKVQISLRYINATINMYKNDHIKMYKINST